MGEGVVAGQLPGDAAGLEKLARLRAGLGMAPAAEPMEGPPPGQAGPGGAAVPGYDPEPQPDVEGDPEAAQAPARRTGVPDWFVVPKEGLPPVEPGTPVAYVRMKPHLTAKPSMGERQCMLTLLTVRDQDFALQRVRGIDPQGTKTLHELACQTVRVIDGKQTDWLRSEARPAGAKAFWEDIGPGYRQRLVEWYAKHHTFSREEKTDFFLTCIDERIAG